MATLSRDDHEFDADFWADLVARLLGVIAALGLALLGLVLLFPASGLAGQLPALPLGMAEPQRPLIGLLCFALSGIIATAVMLRSSAGPVIRGPAPLPREMNLAPAGPAEAPVLAPFPVPHTWRAPLPPMADSTVPVWMIRSPSTPSPEPAPEPIQVSAPEAAPEIVSFEAQPEPAVLDIPAPEASEPVALQAMPDIAPSEPMAIEAPPAPEPVQDDFDARRQRLKATLDHAATLASSLAAEAVGDHQHALAAQDMGDIAAASGAPDRAGDAYDRALLHARTLSEAHPGAPEVQGVLTDVLLKIGDLNAARGRMGAATDAYEEAVARRRAAVGVDPTEKPSLALAEAMEKLAKTRCDQGQLDKARSLYQESLERLSPLQASDTARYVDLVYRARTGLLALDSKA